MKAKGGKIMKFVNLKVRAKGYYSLSTYEENRLVKADTFNKICDDLIEKRYA